MTAPPATPAASRSGPEEDIPLAQRLYDNWFLLLVAGIAIMGLIYTGWGFYEVLTLPAAELP